MPGRIGFVGLLAYFRSFLQGFWGGAGGRVDAHRFLDRGNRAKLRQRRYVANPLGLALGRLLHLLTNFHTIPSLYQWDESHNGRKLQWCIPCASNHVHDIAQHEPAVEVGAGQETDSRLQGESIDWCRGDGGD